MGLQTREGYVLGIVADGDVVVGLSILGIEEQQR